MASAIEGGESLQDAFARFRKRRQEELARNKDRPASVPLRPQEQQDALRAKFLAQALTYQGVPYHPKYHTDPEDPHTNAPLYLDCCGLVRKALRDLRDEFGFDVGTGNQAYQFDTLPIDRDESTMRPGDLVFISGTYFDPTRKAQLHDMVHVEIWMGDGEKTLGARKQTGVIEIHDSYRFVSKSYGEMRYYFKSIDTWLQGVCKSHCAEHAWPKKDAYNPAKKSIFSSLDDGAAGAAPAADETDCGADDDADVAAAVGMEVAASSQPLADATNAPCMVVARPKSSAGRSVPLGGQENKSGSSLATTGKSASGASLSGRTPSKLAANPRGGAAATPRATVAASPAKAATPAVPSFFVGGNNNPALIVEPLTARGWKRLTDVKAADFTLKWVELKRDIDYARFKPGKQLIARNPEIQVLTTKLGLLETLRAYAAKSKGTFAVSDIHPESYMLDQPRERAEFLRVAKAESATAWICKPTGQNQGKGIFLVPDIAVFERELAAEKGRAAAVAPRLIQRYIPNPLLIDGKKFDMRIYMLIANNGPACVLQHDGYLRLSVENYCSDLGNLTAHLTNQYVQKKHASYQDLKDETVWSMGQFNEYFNAKVATAAGVPRDWVLTQFKERVQEIMRTCYAAARPKLDARPGFFDLLGFDIMLDENLKVWLIEVNVNPALFTNCAALLEVIPGVVHKSLDIVLDLHEQRSRGIAAPTLPADLGGFTCIVQE